LTNPEGREERSGGIERKTKTPADFLPGMTDGKAGVTATARVSKTKPFDGALHQAEAGRILPVWKSNSLRFRFYRTISLWA
jgi:hypothetical protein